MSSVCAVRWPGAGVRLAHEPSDTATDAHKAQAAAPQSPYGMWFRAVLSGREMVSRGNHAGRPRPKLRGPGTGDPRKSLGGKPWASTGASLQGLTSPSLAVSTHAPNRAGEERAPDRGSYPAIQGVTAVSFPADC